MVFLLKTMQRYNDFTVCEHKTTGISSKSIVFLIYIKCVCENSGFFMLFPTKQRHKHSCPLRDL